jgi:hypothetical protein
LSWDSKPKSAGREAEGFEAASEFMFRFAIVQDGLSWILNPYRCRPLEQIAICH